jgi:hypothetical protein
MVYKGGTLGCYIRGLRAGVTQGGYTNGSHGARGLHRERSYARGYSRYEGVYARGLRGARGLHEGLHRARGLHGARR